MHKGFKCHIEGRMRRHPATKLGNQLVAEGYLLGSGKVDQGVVNIEENRLN